LVRRPTQAGNGDQRVQRQSTLVRRPRDDRHMDRVLSAIRSAAQARGDTAVADTLAGAIEARERLLARKRNQDEEEAERRQEEESVISGLRVELQALRGTDPV
jgi:hypothetical protein